MRPPALSATAFVLKHSGHLSSGIHDRHCRRRPHDRGRCRPGESLRKLVLFGDAADAQSRARRDVRDLCVLPPCRQHRRATGKAMQFYMLTGSFASNFYAVPRMTRDIDIVIEIQMKEADKIYQLFQKDFYVDKISINDAIQQQSMWVNKLNLVVLYDKVCTHA